MCGSGGGAAVPGGQIRAADRKANEGHGRGARAPGSQEKPAGHISTAVSFGQNCRAGQIAGDGAPSRQTKAGNHEDRSGLGASEAVAVAEAAEAKAAAATVQSSVGAKASLAAAAPETAAALMAAAVALASASEACCR